MMLELLTFDVVLDSPYTYLYDFLKDLHIDNRKSLRNAAWAFINDGAMTTMCLRCTPREIAVAALFFAVRAQKEKIPDIDHIPWWERIGGEREAMSRAISTISQFYRENPLKRPDNPCDQSPHSSEGDLEATRLRLASNSPTPGEKAEAESIRMHKERAREENGEASQARRNGVVIPTIEGETPEEGVASVNGSERVMDGDDDSRLKRAANDPAMHERVNGATNGVGGKRKEEAEEREEPPTKRARRSEDDESEEGEVEE
jgi:protein BUR2